jgi:hydrogenase maturation protease
MGDSNIAILGLGNILLQDEGIGVHIVNKLEQNYTFDPTIKIIDGGTSGLDLLHQFEENDKIIIIDAVDFNQKPGFIQCLANDEISKLFTEKISSHQSGLKDILGAVKLLQNEPSQLYLIGIQPATVETGLKLSDEISNNINKILNNVFAKLKEWNVAVQLS